MMLRFYVILAFATAVSAQNRQEWDAATYPNPTADGFQRCNMKSPSSICDPDAVLSEAQRYRLNYELNQLESRTRQLHGDNFCSKKGIVAAIAVARHVRGGSDNAVKVMANDMLRKWTLDKQCSKSLVIVLATDDKKFWVARDSRVPVYAAEFTELFNAQKSLFKQGDYQQALLNVLEGTWDKAIAKQGPGDSPADDGASRGQPFQPSDPGSKRRPSPGGGGSGGFSPLSIFGKIPLLVWIGIFLIVIPLLCCCCCIYLCCCRGKKGERGGNKRQSPADEDPEQRQMDGGGGGRGRFGGGGIPGFLSGIGGGMAGNAIGNFFRSRGQGGGTTGGGTVVDDGGGAYGGGGYPPASGGYQPGVPQKGGGRGLYPSVEVKDEGGGGSW